MARFLLVLTTMVRMMRTSMPPYPASVHLGIEIHVTLDDWRENKDQTRHAPPRMGSYRSGAQCGFSPPHFPLVAFDRGENDEGKRLARTQGPNSARTAARAFVSGGVTGRAPRACRLWLCFQRGSHTRRLWLCFQRPSSNGGPLDGAIGVHGARGAAPALRTPA